MAFNAEIAAAIAGVEQDRGVSIVPVDMFTFFDQARAQGVDIDGDGAADITTGYLGGLFSLDGIHPTPTGNALIANAFIAAINQRFGNSIQPVNVARVAARDGLVNNRFRPAGEVPFGILGDDSNELEGFFDQLFDRISRRAQDFGNDAGDLGRDFFSRFRRFFRDLF